MYSIRFTNGQTIIASSEEEARAMTGNKTDVFSMNPHYESMKDMVDWMYHYNLTWMKVKAAMATAPMI